MALTEQITGFVAGDDFEITRTIAGVPAGQTLTAAWLTIKAQAGDADPGLVQKHITPTDVPGTGQVTHTGASGTAALRFDLTPTDTALLTGACVFDVQVRTSAGRTYTPCKGTIQAAGQITLAT